MQILRSAALLLAVLGVFSAVSAQEKRITAGEMAAIENKSSYKDKSYRLRRFGKIYNKADGEIINYSDETTEYLPSGDSRTVMEWMVTKGNINRTEIIRLGDTIYSLHPNGQWLAEPLRFGGNSKSNDQPLPKAVEYIYRGRVIYKKLTADLYEVKWVNKVNVKGGETEQITIQKKWFGPDGNLLRTEETTDLGEKISERSFEFEIDPNIKITAPK